MTHTFNLDKGSIRLVVSHDGKKWRRATGLTTRPALWNPKGQSLRARCTDRRVLDDLRLIDARLREKERMKMTEAEAHRYIEKQAMDRCIPRREVAEDIIRTYS